MINYMIRIGQKKRVNEIQKTEVSKMKWCDMNEILSLIRPYNLEKKDIIIKIDKILHKYSLIS